MIKLKNIIEIDLTNSIPKSKVKTVVLENPTIQECLDIVEADEYCMLWPVYTNANLADIPDWSKVSSHQIIKPIYIGNCDFALVKEQLEQYLVL